MNISFAHTTPALVAGAKTVTRREWEAGTIRTIEKLARIREPMVAWDYSPRVRHACPIARVLPVSVSVTGNVPDSDWDAEGFGLLEALPGVLIEGHRPSELWRFWRENRPQLARFEFELVELLPHGRYLLEDRLPEIYGADWRSGRSPMPDEETTACVGGGPR